MMTKAGTFIGLASLPFFALIAEESTNPYEAIIFRNAFGLKPPPPPQPVTPPSTAQKPLPELALTGIADFSFKKWALLVATERGKTPRTYTLTEGQQADGLEVLTIDVHTGTVRVRLDGAELTLSLKEQEHKHLLARAEEKRFVDEHTRAHELREKREAERRARERALVQSQKL
jgi:hypothetical protein